MHLFFSGKKGDMIQIRDLLNELLSDPELDRPDCEISLKNEKCKINVIREFAVLKKEEES